MRVLVTAGHVDHGKTSLVRALTGMEPDRLDEERRRGLTIDLGFAWTTVRIGRRPVALAFVDVPGHHRFVTNMLAGAGAAPGCILVVAADDGWSAQTAEHVTILDLLGVQGAAIAVTKADSVTAERLRDVEEDIRSRVRGTPLWGAPIVAVDSVSGRGVTELTAVICSRLAELKPTASTLGARLWIDRSFTVTGAGTVVTGTLHGGSLRTGQEVQHTPSGRRLRIRGLEALGSSITDASTGSRVAVNLARIAHDEISRGDALVCGPWMGTNQAHVEVTVVGTSTLGGHGSWMMHVGTAQTPVSIRPLLGTIAPGETGPARLEFSRQLPLRFGDRLILRSTGRQQTEAGGSILDPKPPPKVRGTGSRLQVAEVLEELARADRDSDRAYWLLQLRGKRLHQHELESSLGVSDQRVISGATWLGNLLVDTEELTKWEDAALAAVNRAPTGRGSNGTEVTQALEQAGCARTDHRAVLDRMIQTGVVENHGGVIISSTGVTEYTAALEMRRARLVEAFSDTPFDPPDLMEITKEVGLTLPEMQGLFDDGKLMRLADVVLSGDAFELAREKLAMAYSTAPFTASEARQALGTTRKVAIPLLERLQARGITTFDGEYHHFV